jgi:TonB family protein
MKNLLYLGFLLLIASTSNTAYSQIQLMNEICISPPTIKNDNPVDLYSFLLSSLEYPVNSLNNKIEGTEVVRFSVSTSGTIEDITVINSVSREIDREIIRVLQNTSGNWEPGTIDGEPLKMVRELSLSFVLDSYKDMLKTAQKFIQKGNRLMYAKNKPGRALHYYNKASILFPNEEGVLIPRKYCLDRLGRTSEANEVNERMEFLAEQNKSVMVPFGENFISLIEPISPLTPPIK